MVGYEAVDAKHLEVTISITNNGSEAAPGQCTVEAHNRFGDFGFDIFSTEEDIAPGESATGSGFITIQNEGAESVDEVEVKDCGQA